MAQIHISKDPSGQITDIYPYTPMFLNKAPIHPAINGNCMQRQLLTAQTSQGNMTWILRKPVNNFSKDFCEDIEKLVYCPRNSEKHIGNWKMISCFSTNVPFYVLTF